MGILIQKLLNMKKYINIIYLIVPLLFFSSCDKNLLEKEQYKSVLYFLSGEQNIYEYEINLEKETDTAYLSILSSGSLPISEDVEIEIEYDEEGLNEWNYKNFDLNEQDYAKKLSSDRFKIKTYKTVLKANQNDNKVLIPISINSHNLTPDSIFIIPFKFKTINKFEINKDKSNVLLKIYNKNQYCNNKNISNYFMRGISINENEPDKSLQIAASKIFFALDSNLIRTYPSTIPAKKDIDYIKNYAIVLKINEDKSVNILPYHSAIIEDSKQSYYNLEEQKFFLKYKIKLNEEWFDIEESLRKLDIN